MVKITDIKLIEKKEEIETYEGNMRIKFKKIKMKNENDFYLYKSLLLNNDKIYNIIKDNNIIYIYYDINENIDELINIKENKECVIKKHNEPINKKEIEELFKKEDAMCKIKSKKLINGRLEDIDGTGFFLEINMKDILFKKCLLTNNHILNKNDIKLNKEIKLKYKSEIKTIKINENRRVYTNEELDYTCIEIFDKDNIKEYFKIDENLLEYSIESYKNKNIFILQYPKGNEISFSSGIILDIKDNKIIHNSSTNKGSSGSPIISRSSDYSIIGLHYGSDRDYTFNLSTNIISIFNHIKNYSNNKNENNYIIAEIEIKEEDINKKIQIINSYEEAKRINNWKDKKDDYKYENKKEILENCEIKIDNKKINFSFYCIFTKKGTYKIKYTFKSKLSKTCFLFYNCTSLTNINLSNFNTQNVTNMKCMFNGCSSLTNINLSNFNTQNVTNMDSMFCDCTSLTNINLSNFNTQKATNMGYMFYDCSSLTNINLSNFKTQNVTNMLCMFCGCSSLINLNLSNFNTHNVNDMRNMFGYCSSLVNINLSNFNTQKANMNCLFYGCKSLKKEGIISKDINIFEELFQNN